MVIPGADPGFQVRGGGALKKLRRAEGGAKFFWVFRMKNHDFTPKNLYFFQLRREARKFLGYFVWKISILRQKKSYFFQFLGGASPLDPPLNIVTLYWRLAMWFNMRWPCEEVSYHKGNSIKYLSCCLFYLIFEVITTCEYSWLMHFT